MDRPALTHFNVSVVYTEFREFRLTDDVPTVRRIISAAEYLQNYLGLLTM